MGIFQPTMYQKSIYEIDYSLLKKRGIRCLVFDLDNTLGLVGNKECSHETKKLIESLRNDFQVLICSNNTNLRLKPYLKELGIDGVPWSFKPSSFGLRRIMKKYHLKKEEMCLIGDQLVTDVLAGNRFHIMTVLVDPLNPKELMVTGFVRQFEKLIINQYRKKGIFERGKYYE